MTAAGGSAAAMEPTWTIERILRWTQQYFSGRGLKSPRLDAEVLLAHALKANRIRLYTHFDQPLAQSERDAFRALVLRRAQHEPVAYIVGQREFYGREFTVNPAVLIPRPETEHVVEAALQWRRQNPDMAAPRILDIGTGSGALAVTLAAEIPNAVVTACDISLEALQVARHNAVKHAVAERVLWVHCDLFAGVTGLFDMIVSNPPYIDPQAPLPPDVQNFEPHVALFAQNQGMSMVDALCRRAPQYLTPNGLFLCEMGAGQGAAARATLQDSRAWAQTRFVCDLQGHERVICAQTPEAA